MSLGSQVAGRPEDPWPPRRFARRANGPAGERRPALGPGLLPLVITVGAEEGTQTLDPFGYAQGRPLLGEQMLYPTRRR